jgi:hypothetical protein
MYGVKNLTITGKELTDIDRAFPIAGGEVQIHYTQLSTLPAFPGAAKIDASRNRDLKAFDPASDPISPIEIGGTPLADEYGPTLTSGFFDLLREHDFNEAAAVGSLLGTTVEKPVIVHFADRKDDIESLTREYPKHHVAQYLSEVYRHERVYPEYLDPQRFGYIQYLANITSLLFVQQLCQTKSEQTFTVIQRMMEDPEYRREITDFLNSGREGRHQGPWHPHSIGVHEFFRFTDQLQWESELTKTLSIEDAPAEYRRIPSIPSQRQGLTIVQLRNQEEIALIQRLHGRCAGISTWQATSPDHIFLVYQDSPRVGITIAMDAAGECLDSQSTVPISPSAYQEQSAVITDLQLLVRQWYSQKAAELSREQSMSLFGVDTMEKEAKQFSSSKDLIAQLMEHYPAQQVREYCTMLCEHRDYLSAHWYHGSSKTLPSYVTCQRFEHVASVAHHSSWIFAHALFQSDPDFMDTLLTSPEELEIGAIDVPSLIRQYTPLGNPEPRQVRRFFESFSTHRAVAQFRQASHLAHHKDMNMFPDECEGYTIQLITTQEQENALRVIYDYIPGAPPFIHHDPDERGYLVLAHHGSIQDGCLIRLHKRTGEVIAENQGRITIADRARITKTLSDCVKHQWYQNMGDLNGVDLPVPAVRAHCFGEYQMVFFDNEKQMNLVSQLHGHEIGSHEYEDLGKVRRGEQHIAILYRKKFADGVMVAVDAHSGQIIKSKGSSGRRAKKHEKEIFEQYQVKVGPRAPQTVGESTGERGPHKSQSPKKQDGEMSL